MAARPPPSASHAPPSKAARKALLGRLLRLGRPEWPRLAVATVFLLVGSAAALAFPGGMRNVIDGALKGATAQQMDRTAMQMALIALIFGISIALRAYLFNTAGERVVTRLREQLYRRILDQEVGFFDARRTGELTSRLASDTGVLQNAVSANVSMVLRSLRPGSGRGGAAVLHLAAADRADAVGGAGGGDGGGDLRPPGAAARPRRAGRPGGGRGDRRGEHRRPAHRALVRRRGRRRRPATARAWTRRFGLARKRILAGATFMAVGLVRQLHVGGRWCSGTAAGCWPGRRDERRAR